MTRGSLELLDDRHRRTTFIAALIICGVCLFALIVWLSFCTPLAIEDEKSLIEELYRPPR